MASRDGAITAWVTITVQVGNLAPHTTAQGLTDGDLRNIAEAGQGAHPGDYVRSLIEKELDDLATDPTYPDTFSKQDLTMHLQTIRDDAQDMLRGLYGMTLGGVNQRLSRIVERVHYCQEAMSR